MNPLLPVVAYRDRIIASVKRNQVTFIQGETGSGKSTQVPQCLFECGKRIVVTQPRRLAAECIAKRVALELMVTMGKEVGYRVSGASWDSPETRLLFCTDGLELVRELVGSEHPDILAIDEVHEFNLNIEMLLAWSRITLVNNPDMRLVVMSATCDWTELERYFYDLSFETIGILGRTFPIEEQKPGKTVTADTLRLLKEGKSVLVFQPGKKEIESCVEELKAAGAGVPIFSLHSDLDIHSQIVAVTPSEVQRCVVATNIAQTSLTVSDIDAVVDCGTGRMIDTINGVEGLYTDAIPLVDREQRKGRAGRVKPGIYIDHCPKPFARRDARAIPDILRLRLDSVVLRLINVDLDPEAVVFLHQPKPEAIAEARQTLINLGCLDSEGRITDVGKRVVVLPVSPRIGRMLVAADELGVVYDIVTIAAILEAGDLIDSHSDAWRKYCQDEESDLLARCTLYHLAEKMTDDATRVSHGIDPILFKQVRTVRYSINRAVRRHLTTTFSSGERSKILEALYAGMVDRLYRRSLLGDGYKDAQGNIRKLTKNTVIGSPEWIIGVPWSFQTTGKLGPRVLRLINMATRVEPTKFVLAAPHLIVRKPGQLIFNGMTVVP